MGGHRLVIAGLLNATVKAGLPPSGGNGMIDVSVGLMTQTCWSAVRVAAPMVLALFTAKLAVEHYLHYYRVVHGLSSVALRYANVYGPRQSAHGEAGVVAIFAGRLLGGQPSTINGSGTQTRDFVYIDDVVAANLAASEAEWQGEYNVGTGVETSVNELYASLASIAGHDIPAAHSPAKEGEQLRSVLDGSRLQKLAELPERTPLGYGLAKTFAWLRDAGGAR